jgi:hypothetical protein
MNGDLVVAAWVKCPERIKTSKVRQNFGRQLANPDGATIGQGALLEGGIQLAS